MSPLRASTATISPEPDCAARAVAAACWSVLLSVVCSGVPGWPGESHSVATAAPAEFTTTIEVVGVPTRVVLVGLLKAGLPHGHAGLVGRALGAQHGGVLGADVADRLLRKRVEQPLRPPHVAEARHLGQHRPLRGERPVSSPPGG